jgi:hypothetical protein
MCQNPGDPCVGLWDMVQAFDRLQHKDVIANIARNCEFPNFLSDIACDRDSKAVMNRFSKVLFASDVASESTSEQQSKHRSISPSLHLSITTFHPSRLTPLTRRIPATNSGLSQPLPADFRLE